MKKVFSIFLSLLMMVVMLHLLLAVHYCEGQEVAATVSLTGKLASCGITCSEEETPLQGTNFTKHCCEDFVTIIGINSIYLRSYSFVQESYQYNFQVLALSLELTARSHVTVDPLYPNVSPPGALMSTNVDLSDICVFRI